MITDVFVGVTVTDAYSDPERSTHANRELLVAITYTNADVAISSQQGTLISTRKNTQFGHITLTCISQKLLRKYLHICPITSILGGIEKCFFF